MREVCECFMDWCVLSSTYDDFILLAQSLCTKHKHATPPVTFMIIVTQYEQVDTL